MYHKKSYLSNFTILIILIIIIIGYLKYKNIYIEKWQNYVLQPYGYVRSGNDPLYFYRKDRYRKPYRWPFQFYKSYPYPHMAPLN